MKNFLFGKSNQNSLTDKGQDMNMFDNEFDFPGDRQCETLKKILSQLRNLNGVSARDKQVAIEGIQTALRLLRCE